MTGELAEALRGWRDAVDPGEAGVARQPRRRASGLRREEVAALAGISVNYLVRLEQGRAGTPSLSVVRALARALRLAAPAAADLHRLAGHAEPVARVAARHLTPSVQRIVDRFADVPVVVIDAAWVIVAANQLAGAFLGGAPVGNNVALRQFTQTPWARRTPEQDQRFEADVVADLRRQLSRHPDDTAVRALVETLLAGSARFREVWDRRPAGGVASSQKTFQHPVVGPVTVDCDVLQVSGTDLRIVVWTAVPGTADASALELLRVLGTQQFAT